MENGEWEKENKKLKKRKMEGGEWRIKIGEWRMGE